MLISRDLVCSRPSQTGKPGYLIHASNIPPEMFREFGTFWTTGYQRISSVTDQSLPWEAATGGAIRAPGTDDVVAWISADQIEPYLLPTSNEWGEIAP